MTEEREKEQGKEEKPKIVVDDDWKAQAQAEKEKLAKEVEGASGAPETPGASGEVATGAEAGAAPAGARELPPASFTTLVSQLATQAILVMGGMEDPQTKKRYVDLALAKHHIDTLAALEEKTAGNLTDDEKKLLDHALYETRMQYVQIAQHVS